MSSHIVNFLADEPLAVNLDAAGLRLDEIFVEFVFCTLCFVLYLSDLT